MPTVVPTTSVKSGVDGAARSVSLPHCGTAPARIR
jgi:hypothetical protein